MIEDIIGFAKRNRLDILIVIALFFLAFGIRTMPSDKFPDIYGFDSFYAARISKYLITGEQSLPFDDMVTNYPYGRQHIAGSELGWWGLNALTYNMVAPIAGVSGFDYGLFGHVTSWLTAIVGALAVPAVYVFGRIAFNRWVGLGSGMFLAVSGGHLFYSLFGHAENDALGFSLIFLSLLAFVAAVKFRDMRLGLLTTFFFSWASITWQTYPAMVMLISGTILIYFVVYALFMQIGYYQENEEKQLTRRWMIYALLFTVPSAPFYYIFTQSFQYAATGVSALAGAALICSLIEIYVKKIRIPSSINAFKQSPFAVKTGAIAVGVLIVGSATMGLDMIKQPAQFAGVPILQDSGAGQTSDYFDRLQDTIAEQAKIGEADFFQKIDSIFGTMGYMAWFAVIAMILIFAKIFIMPFIKKDFTYEWDILALVFIMFFLWKLAGKLQNLFVLSAAVTFGAGYFFGQLVSVVNYFGKYLGKFEMYPKLGIFAILLLVFFSYNVMIIPNADGFGYDVPAEWFSTFAFIDNNLANGSVITAWWDYGHWLLYFNGGKISVTTDNIQFAPSIYTTALAFTHTTPCQMDAETQQISCETTPEALEKAEMESLSLLKPLGATHILIDKEIVGGITGGKFSALAHIASNYVGCMQTLPCQYQEEGAVYCPIGRDAQGQEVGIPFDKDMWTQAKEVPWPGISLAPMGLPSRVFAREDSSGPNIYMSALQCGGQFQPDPNSPILHVFLQRLFFKDTNLKHVKLIYEDGWNVIYEIDWTDIPEPDDFTEWTKQYNIHPAR